MELFYTKNIDRSKAFLTDGEALHCTKVLRNKPGDNVLVTDGMGEMFNATILSASPKEVVLALNGVAAREDRGYYLHMAVALTKNSERFDWFLEKATELGLDEITPLVCTHSLRKVFNYDRAERVLMSAMKQSLKCRLPKLNEPILASAFLEKMPQEGCLKLMGHCREGEKSALPLLLSNGGERVVIMVGPEGDFSVEEIERGTLSGFEMFHMGSARLRVETAALTAVTAVYLNYLR